MSSSGQGWPGESHRAEKAWFAPICKALELAQSLKARQGPQTPCLPLWPPWVSLSHSVGLLPVTPELGVTCGSQSLKRLFLR